MEEGGYQTHSLWLSDGWETVKNQQWNSPLYWAKQDDSSWKHFTLHGFKSVDENEPVTHISYYEAEAFARWAGCRLPTEFEWEAAAKNHSQQGQFCEGNLVHPQAVLPSDTEQLKQLFGTCWQWTGSAYLPSPNYKPAAGALGEYNGKFMCNQFVLRGGSCATHASHIRPTYRNFFSPDARWQFTGIRLAKGV